MLKVISVILFASVLIDSVAGIVGGAIEKKGNKTYVVALRHNGSMFYNNENFCGGVLISPTHVLTTASCTYNNPLIFAAVGVHYIWPQPYEGEQIQVVKVAQNPFYKPGAIGYNIAVLTLEHASKFTPAKLPSTYSAPQKGQSITDFGWGYTTDFTNPEKSNELRVLSQQVISKDECEKALGVTIGPDTFCAGGEEAESPCGGDEGGPAILENSVATDTDDVVVGLISRGFCGVEGKPAEFASVPEFLDWINQEIGAPQ
ncbi:hypothetical protein PsorP6_019520 [Peronosclerospora sorghi]|nr:hypothetical protein PsorP6_019520 [Peronosclerospora sorghi]